MGSSISVVSSMKFLLCRVQNKDESPIEYFHDQTRLFREINLLFQETKQQVIEGLHYGDLCYYLLARDNENEDGLFGDILVFYHEKYPTCEL